VLSNGSGDSCVVENKELKLMVATPNGQMSLAGFHKAIWPGSIHNLHKWLTRNLWTICPYLLFSDHKALQLGLNALQDWSNKWLLKLNILKCKTVFFGQNINKNYTYSVQGTQLKTWTWKILNMKDLGVIFDSELNFVQHCKEKINTAYSYLGIIKRNFIYLDKDAFVMLYNSLYVWVCEN